ncbi:MAG: radical SAM protein [Woeseiaceae bacterium]
MKSPEYVQLSNAAAITLGIMGGRMYGCECTRCLNLLLTYPEGCRANCAYCGLARHREAERDYADRNFIRVDWPAVPMAEIVDIVAQDPGNSPFHRMCISMITHPRSEQDTFAVLEQWTDRIDPDAIPVSILSNPTTMTRDDVQKCRDLGADIFTVALDAATPALFDRTRGKGVQSPHKWKKYWDTLLEAKDIFGPEKFGAHIIVGMGETEHEVLNLVQELVDLGGHSHMFCFFPEEIIDAGIAFRTSGCPGKFQDDISACDRPYGDSPPSDIASYPFQPKKKDLKKIRKQLDIPVAVE